MNPPAHQVPALDLPKCRERGQADSTFIVAATLPLQLRQPLTQGFTLGAGPSTVSNALQQTRPTLFKARHYRVPQIIAVVYFTLVARIFYPAYPLLTRHLLQSTAGYAKPGPVEMPQPERPGGRHSGQTVYASATQQPEQNRFCLVVCMVRHQ